MAKGHENLIPISERTKDEAREISKKGGKASGAARRRKRSMKQVMEMLLQMPANTAEDLELLVAAGINVNDLDDDTVNNLLIVNAALLQRAKAGDVAAIKELRSVIQDDYFAKEKLKLEKEKLKLEKAKAEMLTLGKESQYIDDNTREEVERLVDEAKRQRNDIDHDTK